MNASEIQLKGLRVLIVEDEPNTREAFAESLRPFGVEAETASSAKEG